MSLYSHTVHGVTAHTVLPVPVITGDVVVNDALILCGNSPHRGATQGVMSHLFNQ